MAHLSAHTDQPLTLSEQLDAMLFGWLERNARLQEPARPGLRAKAVTTIAEAALPEVERFCAKWAMKVERWTAPVAVIEGPALAIQGFAEITRMYRR
jgi:hypothetical protein